MIKLQDITKMEKQTNDTTLFLSDGQEENIRRGVEVIDMVVDKIVLPYSTMTNNKIMLAFTRIFAHKDDDLVAHYIDKFICSAKKDWGIYMLNAECQIVREFFDYHSIPMEADKITDTRERIIAQLSEKDRFEIFPFEYEITRRFFLYANNHSLDDLDKWKDFAGIKEQLQKAEIDLYGNGLNWAKAWNCFNGLSKGTFVLFLMDYK
jgi:hypothetical protein